jgi:hypothetical protein
MRGWYSDWLQIATTNFRQPGIHTLLEGKKYILFIHVSPHFTAKKYPFRHMILAARGKTGQTANEAEAKRQWTRIRCIASPVWQFRPNTSHPRRFSARRPEGTHLPETFMMGMRGNLSPRQKSFNNRVRPN